VLAEVRCVNIPQLLTHYLGEGYLDSSCFGVMSESDVNTLPQEWAFLVGHVFMARG
jgi:hypothetical protein